MRWRQNAFQHPVTATLPDEGLLDALQAIRKKALTQSPAVYPEHALKGLEVDGLRRRIGDGWKLLRLA